MPPGGNETSAITRIEISDPAQHIKYFCYQFSRTCSLTDYNVVVSEPVVPVGPIGDGKHYLSREDLGKNEVEGVETIGTRETVTTSAGAMGNDREVALSKEFWYSPKLAINLVVKRFDPVQGTQTFTVSNLQLAEPDARLFTVPAGYKVIDERTGRVNSWKITPTSALRRTTLIKVRLHAPSLAHCAARSTTPTSTCEDA